jgi:hypothetical protein
LFRSAQVFVFRPVKQAQRLYSAQEAGQQPNTT